MKHSNQKIGLVCLTSQQSGWSDHFATIAHGIAKTSYIPIVYTSNEAAKSFEDYSFQNVNAYNYTNKNIVKSLLQIFKISKRINFDDCAAVLIYGDSLQHMLLLILIRKPIVTHIADPYPHNGEKKIVWLRSAITQIPALLKAKKIFLASDDVLKQCESRYSFLTSFNWIKDKLHAVKFSNLIQFEKKCIDLKVCQEKKWDFIYFGRDEPYKGLDVLVNALFILKEKGFNPRVLIISKNFQNISGLENLYVVSNYLSHSDLIQYISDSRWGVFPYTDATGTHTVQICNKFGVPVLASSVGSFKEYIINNKNGCLVEPRNHLLLANRLEAILRGQVDCLKSEQLVAWSSEYFSNSKSTIEILKLIEAATAVK